MPPSADSAPILRDTWKKTRQIIDDFWRIWSATYLSELRKKKKWATSVDGPRIGQIVILIEDAILREQWRLAKVDRIINADKNHPRRFLVKDASGKCFDRHVSGIIPLELEAE